MKHALDVLGKVTVFVLAAMLLGAQVAIEYGDYKMAFTGSTSLFTPFHEWSYPMMSAGHLLALVYTWFKRATLKWWWWYLVLPLIALSVSAALALFTPEIDGAGYYYHPQVVFDKPPG